MKAETIYLIYDYANRPYSNDVVTLDGVMDIKLSKLTRAMKPLFKVFGTLVPYEGWLQKAKTLPQGA